METVVDPIEAENMETVSESEETTAAEPAQGDFAGLKVMVIDDSRLFAEPPKPC